MPHKICTVAYRASRRPASSREALLTAAVLAALAAAAPAQRQFDELRKRGLPADSNNTRALAMGDVDGDSDLDLILGNDGEQNQLYLNDGQGHFTDVTAARMPVETGVTQAVALGDVDGDGDLDMVFGNGPSSGEQNRLYLNDGRGHFTDATAAHLPLDRDRTRAMALGDVDGDGDLDLILGNGYYGPTQQNRLYLNDGQGHFSDATAARLPADGDNTSAVALGDIDGDGDLDLVFGNGSYIAQQNRLYLNDGQGRFNDVTSAHMPALADETNAVALGDVDGDGDLDLVFGNGALFGQQNRLYLNDGQGHFNDATARLPADRDYTSAVALGDADGDGDLDLVFGNSSYFARQNRLDVNHGNGTFADATALRMPVDNEWTLAVALGDLDGDGDLDMVFGNIGAQNRLYLNDGPGHFNDATAARLPVDGDRTRAVALGDIDGDGDLDMVIANYNYQSREPNRLYLNDGQGRFKDATAARLPADRDNTSAVALGDVDGDGDLDLVFGNGGTSREQNRLYLNDGQGHFNDATAARMPVDSDSTNAVALGDIDGDGDLDMVLGNGSSSGEQNRLYLNDGQGHFNDATAARLPVDTDGTHALALGDVDSDGDLDLVFGNGGAIARQNRLYLNDGQGHFVDATGGRLPVDNDSTSAVALGDVDGDGDLDMVCANYQAPSALPQNRLYLNDGRGTFTDATTAQMPRDNDNSVAVALGDVDGDGDLDMVFGNANRRQDRLYLNDGQGHFHDATAARLPANIDFTSTVALGDVDDDGDLDMVFGNNIDQSRLYLNLRRQLDQPFLSSIGRTCTLEAYARYGPPSVVDVALPVLSTGTASIPVPPFGTFRLDPNQLFPLPAFIVPQPAGVGSITFIVPTDQGLVGLSVYAQALLLPYPFQARLTNFTAEVILR